MRQSKLKLSYTERIVYARQFRSLQDKTQLFYPSQKQRVRTRLTHTLEVRTIAHRIACLLNEKIGAHNAGTEGRQLLPADPELIDAIALAHDIGHTPFGHIGERTIDAVVSGRDDLGGMIRKSSGCTMRFKHNANSMRILVELGVDDWRITEGALAHTRICYKNDRTAHQNDPYQPFANAAYQNLTRFILEQNGLRFRDSAKTNPPSLTLEGQIVALADEIAQRAADLGDAKIKARYLDKMERALVPWLHGRKCPEEINTSPYARLEWAITTTMTEDAAGEIFRRLLAQVPEEGKYHGITHGIYREKIADFSKDMQWINEQLDTFVSSFLAQSEEVRESDSRSRYIIRQLYKAYLNDVTLLPDSFLESHLNRIANGSAFRETIGIQDGTDIAAVLTRIRNKDWYVRSEIVSVSGRQLLNIGTVRDYFSILKSNNAKGAEADPALELLFDAFLLDVGCYIAGMTNTEAFDAYNRIYGHTL